MMHQPPLEYVIIVNSADVTVSVVIAQCQHFGNSQEWGKTRICFY